MYIDEAQIKAALCNDTTENLFDGSDYERGDLEQLKAESEGMGQFLTALAKELVAKGVLPAGRLAELIYHNRK